MDAIRFLLKDSDSLEVSIEECLDCIILKMNYKENRAAFAFLEGEKTLSPDEIVYIESNLHKDGICKPHLLLSGKKSS